MFTVITREPGHRSPHHTVLGPDRYAGRSGGEASPSSSPDEADDNEYNDGVTMVKDSDGARSSCCTVVEVIGRDNEGY